MRCRRFHRLLSSYFDGELEANQKTAAEKHLRGCAKCRQALNDLRLIVSDANNLVSATLTSDLWPAIERSVLAQPAAPPPRDHHPAPLSGWRPRVAWALATACVFLTLFLLRQHIYSPSPSPPSPQSRTQLLTAAKTDLDLAQEHYQNSVTALEKIVAHRAHEMDPERTDLYREKLAQLEEAIDECSLAVERNSYDMRAQRALFDAYETKISTLREMAVAAAY